MIILIFFTEKKYQIEGANTMIFFKYLRRYRKVLPNIDKNQLIKHMEKIKKIISIIVEKTLEFSPDKRRVEKFQKKLMKNF